MEFRLLGPLEARSGRKRLRLGGPKQRGVLALLLLNANEVVSVDRLVDDLWGERPPKTAEAYVQNCISRLRAVLGHDRIETEPPGYRLRVEPNALDTFRFERALELAAELEPSARAAALSEALALWRGPPLADLAFESFAQTEIARLDELRLAVLERRLEAELELGRHHDVLAEVEALAMRHPARERLRYLQMLALYRSGRQRDALRVYQEARLELVEQFGLEPGDDLRALERMIIAHDPALRLAPTQPVRESPSTATQLVVELPPMTRDEEAASLAEIGLIVDRHGGTVADPSGDDVEARFGGGDDDTLRALRAAIQIRDASADHGARIAVERGSAADATGQARAMLTRARPGDLLLGPAALRLVSRAVDVVPREAGTGYRVLRFDPEAEPFGRRLDTPLVGRASELARLEAELDAALQTGSPRRVVVVGEAGIGKTRVARELVTRLRSPSQIVAARCVPYGEGAEIGRAHV